MDEDQLFFGNSDEYLEDLGASRLRNWRVSTPLLTISCEKSGIPEVPKDPCHWRSAVVNRFCFRFHGNPTGRMTAPSSTTSLDWLIWSTLTCSNHWPSIPIACLVLNPWNAVWCEKRKTHETMEHHTQWGGGSLLEAYCCFSYQQWCLLKRIPSHRGSPLRGSFWWDWDGCWLVPPMDDVHLPALTRDWGLKNC